MLKVALFVCITIAIASTFTEKTLVNPLTVFATLWAALLFFQNISLYGLYETDDAIYEMIMIGIISFAFGYVISKYGIGKKFRIKTQREYADNKIVLRKKLVHLLAIVCVILYLMDFCILFPFIQSGGLSGIRAMCQDPNSIIYTRRSGIENAVRTLFVYPFSFALLPITAVEVWKKNKDRFLIGLCVLLITLKVFTEGGRVIIAYFMLHLILVFLYRNKSEKESIKEYNKNKGILRIKKKRLYLWIFLIVIIIIGGLLLYVTTLARSGEDAAIHLYFYVAMQGQMFQVWAKIVDEAELVGFGLASLNGFLYPIIYIIKNLLGFDSFPGYWGRIVEMIMATDSEWQWIASYGRANAFVSVFWFMYLDGRLAGIIIGMFIYGALSCYIYKTMKWHPNEKNMCLHILIMQGLIFSLVRMQFSNVMYAYAFIYIILMYKSCSKGLVKQVV